MNQILTQIATITVVMLVLDVAWLTATAASSQKMIAGIQGKPMQMRWLAAAAAYAIMIAAVWYFAVEPAATWYEAAGRGAILGFVMYGLYDMTNYATLAAYPLDFALRDMAWGTYLFAVTAAVAKLV